MVNVHVAVREGGWIAIQVRCGWERLTATHLRQKGYEEFLPEYVPRRSRSRDRAEARAALFPGYLFCRYTWAPKHKIVETPGVIRLVGTGKSPTEIPETEIVKIRQLVDSGVPSKPWRHIQVGDLARIEAGPLCGLEGVLVAVRNELRFVISVALLQRSVAVEVDAGDVVLLRSASSAGIATQKAASLVRGDCKLCLAKAV